MRSAAGRRKSQLPTQTFEHGWVLNERQIQKLIGLGLSIEDISAIISYTGPKPSGMVLDEYIFRASLSGIRTSDFVEIARSGMLAKNPDLATIRRYIRSVPDRPFLAMLAMRANIRLSEIESLILEDNFTEENLRAMIELSSHGADIN